MKSIYSPTALRLTLKRKSKKWSLGFWIAHFFSVPILSQFQKIFTSCKQDKQNLFKLSVCFHGNIAGLLGYHESHQLTVELFNLLHILSLICSVHQTNWIICYFNTQIPISMPIFENHSCLFVIYWWLKILHSNLECSFLRLTDFHFLHFPKVIFTVRVPISA